MATEVMENGALTCRIEVVILLLQCIVHNPMSESAKYVDIEALGQTAYQAPVYP